MKEILTLSVIQGLTEFLPISSSGHLAFIDYTQNNHVIFKDVSLTIWLHFGTLLAVIVFFWSDIYQLARRVFSIKKNEENIFAKIFTLKLITSTTITIIGILVIRYFFAIQSLSIHQLGIAFMINGIIIALAEWWQKRQKKSRNFTWHHVIILGIVQSFALFPGLSRSGLTIAYLISQGMKRSEALTISFFLSIPIILASGVGFWLEAETIQFGSEILLGSCVAFLLALATIWWMTKLVKKYWILFAPYCFLLGVGIWILG